MSTIKANNYEASTAGNNLIFKTNNAERMRIDTSGNVGIGTNTPDSKLHVVGSQIKFDTSTTAGLRLYEDADSASFLRFRPLNASQRGFVFSNDGDSPHLTISWDAANSSTTRVGIGTASPAVELDVSGEARSSTSTTSASNAKTLTTKDYVDSRVADGTTIPIGGIIMMQIVVVTGNNFLFQSTTSNTCTNANISFSYSTSTNLSASENPVLGPAYNYVASGGNVTVGTYRIIGQFFCAYSSGATQRNKIALVQRIS